MGASAPVKYHYFHHFFTYCQAFLQVLSVISCHVPCNTVESMINSFLSSPTIHAQSVDL